MYVLALEPAVKPVDYNAAVRALYAHAHHRHQIVRKDAEVDGVHYYSLLSSLDRAVEETATITLAAR
jgi:hypothetical protein